MIQSNFINIYYQNVRGLRSKTTQFRLGMFASNWDIVALTETWLIESIGSAELFPPEYQVFRRDRCELRTGLSRGGGVLVAVAPHIKVTRLLQLEDEGENIWLKLEMSNKKRLVISNSYFPPNSPLHVYLSYFEKLYNLNLNNENLLLLGDYNLPISGTDFNLALGNDACKQLLFLCSMFNLKLKNNVKNELGKTLDLVITDISSLFVIEDSCPLVKVDKHHPPLSITYENKGNKIIKESTLLGQNHIYNFKKADFLSLYKDISSISWRELENIDNVNLAVDYFYNKLYSVFDLHVPKAKSVSSKYPTWFNRSLILLIKKKERLRRMYNKYKMLDTYNQYKLVRSKIKKEIKSAYRVYISNLEADVLSNPQQFWNVVKRLKVSDKNPSTMRLGDSEAVGGEAISEAFASYFKSVYEPCRLSSDELCRRALCSPTLPGMPCLSISCLTTSDVLNALKGLKPKRSLGPDLIPPYILKGCAECFVKPLLYIFNLSINKSDFPVRWKKAKIIPIFKKGERDSINNYRPISILPAPVKVFESIIHRKLFLHVKNYLSPRQHGFYPKRSINSNLLHFSEYCISVIDEGSQVDVIYTDFEKAFDKVNHLSLLSRLNYFGLSESLVKFFCSYLRGRKQFVYFDGVCSKEFYVESGVPQGSNLGPLLFLLFIDNLKDLIINCEFLLYADDLKLFCNIKSQQDCSLMQDDIDRLYVWSLNNLKFHVNKCALMTFSKRNPENIIKYNYNIGGHILSSKSTIRDLGVIFDPKFSFNDHVVSICKSAFVILGLIRRLGNIFTNIRSIKLLYCSLVRSRLEYASVVWYPHVNYLSELIERVQKRFLRYAYYRAFGHYTMLIPYHELLLMFEMDSLSARRGVAMMLYLHQLVGGKLDDALLLSRVRFAVPRHGSRSRLLFSPHFSRTCLGTWSPLNTMMRLYNSLTDNDVDIFFNSQTEFRNIILK